MYPASPSVRGSAAGSERFRTPNQIPVGPTTPEIQISQINQTLVELQAVNKNTIFKLPEIYQILVEKQPNEFLQ